jgi:hypothetical protein
MADMETWAKRSHGLIARERLLACLLGVLEMFLHLIEEGVDHLVQ